MDELSGSSKLIPLPKVHLAIFISAVRSPAVNELISYEFLPPTTVEEYSLLSAARVRSSLMRAKRINSDIAHIIFFLRFGGVRFHSGFPHLSVESTGRTPAPGNATPAP